MRHLHTIELPTPFPVGPINVFLANAPGEPLTLIDTGPRTSKTRSALDAGLAERGYTAADLERIVISHAHVDHFGLAADLVAESGAEVLSHGWNQATLEDFVEDRSRRTTFYASLLRQAAVPPEVLAIVGQATGGIQRFAAPVVMNRALEDGDVLTMAGREWQVLHTPGHAAGLVCLYQPKSRTLLSSDHLLADISSNPVVEPPPPGHSERPRSLALYKDSLQRVADLDVLLALPSHGAIIHDIAGLVKERLAFHERRASRIIDALGNGARTTWDVTQVLFPNRSPLDIFLAVSEVIGHLDVLEMEGLVVATEQGEVMVWRLTE